MSLTTLEDRIGKVVDNCEWAMKLTDETLATLLPPIAPVVGTMGPATKSYVYAFGLILRAFANAPELKTRYGLRRSLNMHAVDLREANFNDAWTAWEDAVKSATALNATANFTMDGIADPSQADLGLEYFEALFNACKANFTPADEGFLKCIAPPAGENGNDYWAPLHCSLQAECPPGDPPPLHPFVQDTIATAAANITDFADQSDPIQTVLTNVSYWVCAVAQFLFEHFVKALAFFPRVEEDLKTRASTLNVLSGIKAESFVYISIVVLTLGLINRTFLHTRPARFRFMSAFVKEKLDGMTVPMKFKGKFAKVYSRPMDDGLDVARYALFSGSTALNNSLKLRARLFAPVHEYSEEGEETVLMNRYLCIVPDGHGAYPLWRESYDEQLLTWITSTRWRMVPTKEEDDLGHYQTTHKYIRLKNPKRPTEFNDSVEVLFFGFHPSGTEKLYMKPTITSCVAITSHTGSTESADWVFSRSEETVFKKPGIYCSHETDPFVPNLENVVATNPELQLYHNYTSSTTDVDAMMRLAHQMYARGLGLERQKGSLVLICLWNSGYGNFEFIREALKFTRDSESAFKRIGVDQEGFMKWAQQHKCLRIVDDFLMHDNGTLLKQAKCERVITVENRLDWVLSNKVSWFGMILGTSGSLVRMTLSATANTWLDLTTSEETGRLFGALTQAAMSPERSGITPNGQLLQEVTTVQDTHLENIKILRAEAQRGTIARVPIAQVPTEPSAGGMRPNPNPVKLLVQPTGQTATTVLHTDPGPSGSDAIAAYSKPIDLPKGAVPDKDTVLFLTSVLNEMATLPKEWIAGLVKYGVEQANTTHAFSPSSFKGNKTKHCWVVRDGLVHRSDESGYADITKAIPYVTGDTDNPVQVLEEHSDTAVAVLAQDPRLEICFDPAELINNSQAIIARQQSDLLTQLQTAMDLMEPGSVRETLNKAINAEMVKIAHLLNTADTLHEYNLTDRERKRLSALVTLKLELVSATKDTVLGRLQMNDRQDIKEMSNDIISYVNECIVGMTINETTQIMTYQPTTTDPYYFEWAKQLAINANNRRKQLSVSEAALLEGPLVEPWEECMLLQIGSDTHQARHLDLIYMSHRLEDKDAEKPETLLHAYALGLEPGVAVWLNAKTKVVETAAADLTVDTSLATEWTNFLYAYAADRFSAEELSLRMETEIKHDPDAWMIEAGILINSEERSFNRLKKLSVAADGNVDNPNYTFLEQMLAKAADSAKLLTVPYPTIKAICQLAVVLNGTYSQKAALTFANVGQSPGQVLDLYYQENKEHLKAITQEKNPEEWKLLHLEPGPVNPEQLALKINMTALLAAHSQEQKNDRLRRQRMGVAKAKATYNVANFVVTNGYGQVGLMLFTGLTELLDKHKHPGHPAVWNTFLSVATYFRALPWAAAPTNTDVTDLHDDDDWSAVVHTGIDFIDRAHQVARIVGRLMHVTLTLSALDKESMVVTYLMMLSQWRQGRHCLSAMTLVEFFVQVSSRLLIEAMASRTTVTIFRNYMYGATLFQMDKWKQVGMVRVAAASAAMAQGSEGLVAFMGDLITEAMKVVVGDDIVAKMLDKWTVVTETISMSVNTTVAVIGPTIGALTGRKIKTTDDLFNLLRDMKLIELATEAADLKDVTAAQMDTLRKIKELRELRDYMWVTQGENLQNTTLAPLFQTEANEMVGTILSTNPPENL
jgi:hypothetical protein